MNRKMELADDDIKSVPSLFKLRVPSLAVGLFLGLILSFTTSRFEEVLSQNVSVAFFIPFVVYLAAAVGSQTQSIYARDLKSGKASFHKYFIKELLLGLMFGIVFSTISAAIVLIWFKSQELALVVSLAVLGTAATAPTTALLVTQIFNLEHTDPAAGAGPIATAIQDTISVLIYGFIASGIMLA